MAVRRIDHVENCKITLLGHQTLEVVKQQEKDFTKENKAFLNREVRATVIGA